MRKPKWPGRRKDVASSQRDTSGDRVLAELAVEEMGPASSIAASLAPNGEWALVSPGSDRPYVIPGGEPRPEGIPKEYLCPDVGAVRGLCVSADGRWAAARSPAPDTCLWWPIDEAGRRDPEQLDAAALPSPPFGLSAIRFSPDGRFIAAGGFELVVAETHLAGPPLTFDTGDPPPGGRGTFEDVGFSADGSKVLATALEGLWTWDMLTGERTHVHPYGLMQARACVLSGDGTTLAGGTVSGRVVVLDTTTGEHFVDRTVSDDPVWTIALDQSATVVAYDDAGTVTVRDLDSWSCLRAVPIEGAVRSLSFNNDGSRLLVVEEVLARGGPSGTYVFVRLLRSGL
jgi:WD40 repeat protein